jgi:hypothetical protein
MKWIKVLYHDLNSCIIVNKFISQPVKISRSVKQGCSLSPLLYVLCLEPFVRKVCKDKEIEGLKLPGSPDQCKISVFADGTYKCPKYFKQLYTIHGFKNGHYIPLVFCLLPSKSEACYRKMFSLLDDSCKRSTLICVLKQFI